MVRADIRGEDGVILLANLQHAPTGFHIPHNHAPEFGGATTAGHEQLAVSTELQNIGATFIKGKHANQTQRIGVVKQDLMLTGDG